VQRRNISQPHRSGSTRHDQDHQVTTSSRSFALLVLNQRRWRLHKYRTVIENSAGTSLDRHSSRQESSPLHPQHVRSTVFAIISGIIRRHQIPIAHAAPSTYPFPRFRPLKAFGRRPSPHAAPPHTGRHPKPLSIAPIPETRHLRRCRDVPIATNLDRMHAAKPTYSIAWSVNARSPGGISRPVLLQSSD
jgi:hypothetical protein